MIRHLCFVLEDNLHCKDLFTRTVKVTVFVTVLKWVERISVELFTSKDVKKMKGAANKNGDFNRMCEQTLMTDYFTLSRILSLHYVFKWSKN